MIRHAHTAHAVRCIAELAHLESFKQIEMQRPLPLINKDRVCQRRVQTLVCLRHVLRKMRECQGYIQLQDRNAQLTAQQVNEIIRDLEETFKNATLNLECNGLLHDPKIRKRVAETIDLLKVSAISDLKDRANITDEAARRLLDDQFRKQCKSDDRIINFTHATMLRLHAQLGEMLTAITREQIAPGIRQGKNFIDVLTTAALFEPEWFQVSSGLYKAAKDPRRAANFQAANPPTSGTSDGLQFEEDFDSHNGRRLSDNSSRKMLLNVIHHSERIPGLRDRMDTLREQFSELAMRGRTGRYRSQTDLINAGLHEKKIQDDPRQVYNNLVTELRSIAMGKNRNTPEAINRLMRTLEDQINKDGVMEWIVQHLATIGTKGFLSPFALMAGAPFRRHSSNPINLLEALYCKGSDAPICAEFFHGLRQCILQSVAAPTDAEIEKIRVRYTQIDESRPTHRLLLPNVKKMLTTFNEYRTNADNPTGLFISENEPEIVMGGLLVVMEQRMLDTGANDNQAYHGHRKLCHKLKDIIQRQALRLEP